jgi:Fis family transcriptional regulator
MVSRVAVQANARFSLPRHLSIDGHGAKIPSRRATRLRVGPLRDACFQGANTVVNAAISLRADAAHEPSLQPALRECVARAVRRYLSDVESEPAEGLHALVLREVESPLLREVLAWYNGNQSRAAAALGINRATLRKKLQQYGLAE